MNTRTNLAGDSKSWNQWSNGPGQRTTQQRQLNTESSFFLCAKLQQFYQSMMHIHSTCFIHISSLTGSWVNQMKLFGHDDLRQAFINAHQRTKHIRTIRRTVETWRNPTTRNNTPQQHQHQQPSDAHVGDEFWCRTAAQSEYFELTTLQIKQHFVILDLRV